MLFHHSRPQLVIYDNPKMSGHLFQKVDFRTGSFTTRSHGSIACFNILNRVPNTVLWKINFTYFNEGIYTVFYSVTTTSLLGTMRVVRNEEPALTTSPG